MTIVVTRNVPDRTRGFLASVMLEIAPGVYISPRMNVAVRERIWVVLNKWASDDPDEGVVMVFNDSSQPGGLGIQVIGAPKTDIVDIDGMFVVRREPTKAQMENLKKKLGSLTVEDKTKGSKIPEDESKGSTTDK